MQMPAVALLILPPARAMPPTPQTAQAIAPANRALMRRDQGDGHLLLF